MFRMLVAEGKSFTFTPIEDLYQSMLAERKEEIRRLFSLAFR
ncbi:hypothetical protein ACEQPO_15630 [Bacillus sp. SL00103]